MSSTRVKDRIGKHLDFYETPSKAIDGVLSDFIDDNCTVLEPCAGRGAIVERIRELYPHAKITAIEIQDEFELDLRWQIGIEYLIQDFLKVNPKLYDRIITNPPFSQAEEFIRHSFNFLNDNGKMAFLLRLPFVAGVKRFNLFKEHKPIEIKVLSQRPKFGGSNIDSCDYAWFIWNKESAKETKLSWIEPR